MTMRNSIRIMYFTLVWFACSAMPAAAQDSEFKALQERVSRMRAAEEAASKAADEKATTVKTLEKKLAELKVAAADSDKAFKIAQEEAEKAKADVSKSAESLARAQKSESDARAAAEKAKSASEPDAATKEAEAKTAQLKLTKATEDKAAADKAVTEKVATAAKVANDTATVRKALSDSEALVATATEAAKAEAAKAAIAKAELVKAEAEQKGTLALSDSVYAKSLSALTMLFVIAVLLESALSIIFNWRVFLTYFSLAGVKTVVMVVVSLVVVHAFDVDILANLIAAYKSAPGVSVPLESGSMSKFITALILAGGSAGVHNIMAALGYRNSSRVEEVITRPPRTEAWVSVRVKRQNAVGQINVTIDPLPVPAANPPAPVAGTISSGRPSLMDILLRNPNRFPHNGGYSLSPNVAYQISVEGADANGNALSRLGGQYVFAPGAIVDFEVTM